MHLTFDENNNPAFRHGFSALERDIAKLPDYWSRNSLSPINQ